MSCAECYIPPGKSVAHCAKCHVTFASDTLFDKHIRQNKAGTIHLDPRELTDHGHPLVFDRDRWRSSKPRPETMSYAKITASGVTG